VCGAGEGEGAGTSFGAGAGEETGAGQVGGDESMFPPNYDPADGLSLSYDTPALTLSRNMATTSGKVHMVALAFLPKVFVPQPNSPAIRLSQPHISSKNNVDICSVM
jgi:hypothetical protein